MTDEYRCAIADDLVEMGVDLIFGDGVKGGCGFVEDDKGRILIKGAGNGNFLGFATGDFYSVSIKIFVKAGIQALGHLLKPKIEADFLKGRENTGLIIFKRGGYILSQWEREEIEILKYNGKDRKILFVLIFADIDAVQEDLAFGRVVKAAKQLDEGGLSAAVHANDGHSFANMKFNIHMTQGIGIRCGVAEGNISEFDFISVIAVITEGPFFNRQGTLIHTIGHIDIGKYILHIPIVVLQ